MYQYNGKRYTLLRSVALAILNEDRLACQGHTVHVRAGSREASASLQSIQAILAPWGFDTFVVTSTGFRLTLVKKPK